MTNRNKMTKEKWGLVLSAISFALDNDPTFIDDVGEYKEDGEKLRQAFSVIFDRYVR